MENQDFEGMRVSSKQMSEIMENHGMNERDIQDFHDKYSYAPSYLVTDIREFLGY